MKTYTIKPLVWENGGFMRSASNPLASIDVSPDVDNARKWHWSVTFKEYYDDHGDTSTSLEAAKQAAWDYYVSRIEDVLVEANQ